MIFFHRERNDIDILSCYSATRTFLLIFKYLIENNESKNTLLLRSLCVCLISKICVENWHYMLFILTKCSTSTDIVTFFITRHGNDIGLRQVHIIITQFFSDWCPLSTPFPLTTLTTNHLNWPLFTHNLQCLHHSRLAFNKLCWLSLCVVQAPGLNLLNVDSS